MEEYIKERNKPNKLLYLAMDLLKISAFSLEIVGMENRCVTPNQELHISVSGKIFWANGGIEGKRFVFTLQSPPIYANKMPWQFSEVTALSSWWKKRGNLREAISQLQESRNWKGFLIKAYLQPTKNLDFFQDQTYFCFCFYVCLYSLHK